jgi:glucose/arabinose dehydrogenase
MPMSWSTLSTAATFRRRSRVTNRSLKYHPNCELLENRLAPANLPPGFTESIVANNLSDPTSMEIAPDGRIFVTEQGGRLRVIQNGTLLSQPFLNLNVNSSGERGLLGVAFDPNFASNHFVYVYYTVNSPVHNRVSRFTANGNVAASGSEQVILDLNNLSSATNHNGGAIHFGLDGKLYVAVGENANPSNSQTLGNLLGKLLRINPNGSIPNDNPFFNSATGMNRAIWALGLRNPFTFGVQPGTGRIFINDVGQDTFEEINDGIAGSNYGWPLSEGFREPGDTLTTIGAYRDPLFTYDHTFGPTGGCAITGGAFYNPTTSQFPASYTGDYFFADLCSSWIRTFDPTTQQASDFASNLPAAPVDLKVDTTGNLYYLTRGFGSNTGQVTRVQFTETVPEITQQPTDQRVAAGQAATFTASVIGATPLTLQWQRNGVDIPGANASSFTLPSTSLSDDGDTFRLVATNSLGMDTSDDALLTVVDNDLPSAVIDPPSAGSFYNAGDAIEFEGTATDAEDGVLPASAFTWRVDFHHADHTHPFIQPFSGVTSGQFQIPTTGETSTDVFYRIELTVTDSFGFSTTTFRDILPNTSQISISTTPSGLSVLLDGIPTATPVSIPSVVGMTRTLAIVAPNVSAGIYYEFVSWSDGGNAQHDITTPAIDSGVSATFQVIAEPHVTGVAVSKDSKRSRIVTVTFDRPLDTTSAITSGNYRITAPGRDKRFNTPLRPSNDDPSIGFENPEITNSLPDPVTGRVSSIVTLTVPRGITTNSFFELTIDATSTGPSDAALEGINGDLLDGELSGAFPSGDGSAGGDFVAIFGFGRKFKYADASGDSVTLELLREGTLSIVRAAPTADGIRSEGLLLALSDVGPRTWLIGRVRNGQTSIDRVTGLSGVSNNILSNPSFALGQVSAVVVDRVLDDALKHASKFVSFV